MNPLSAIFEAGVSIRNALYDRGVFNVKKLSRPVVSVGNLSVGGSGKTPLVIALGRLLKSRGIEFDVLSRGYGRSATETAIVDPKGTASEFGDEPLLIARKLQVPVIVSADRYRAGVLAEQNFSSRLRLHLLDDGFQHRRLHRDFDIVILRAEDLRDRLLPVGRLREPVSSLRRADAVVTLDSVNFSTKPVWKGRRQVTVPAIQGSIIAFCGIARPKEFFERLRGAGIKVADTVVFPDHHRYGEADVDRLVRRKSSTGAGGFITTEKDLINLGSLSNHLGRLHCAQLDVVLQAPDEVIGMLERQLGCLS